MSHGDGGKGSGRRNEDVSKVKSNWDLIDWSNKGESKVIDEDNDYEEENEEHEHDDDEGYPCPVCRGEMSVTGTCMYWFCDTCGHREELEHDY